MRYLTFLNALTILTFALIVMATEAYARTWTTGYGIARSGTYAGSPHSSHVKGTRYHNRAYRHRKHKGHRNRLNHKRGPYNYRAYMPPRYRHGSHRARTTRHRIHRRQGVRHHTKHRKRHHSRPRRH